MKNWWKVLAIILILYSFIAGILIPLKPGVLGVFPESVKSGETVTIKVEGYNAHYTTAQNQRAWLRIDSLHSIQAKSTKAISQDSLAITFDIPSTGLGKGKSVGTTLVLDNEKDGYSLLPNAIQIIESDSIQNQENATKWQGEITDATVSESLSFPYRNILYETIRNLFYHVPLWFAMLIIFLVAAIYSGMYLGSIRGGRVGVRKYDQIAVGFTQVGILYGILGLITGAVWARWTWGEWWSFDVKQNMSAIAMLIYLAYLVLRGSFSDDFQKQARISAVYNIFSFTTLIPLLFVIPRLYDSLHPGNGGNPGFGGEDLDNTMRMVFYPAIIGWILLGIWLSELAYRFIRLKERWLEQE